MFRGRRYLLSMPSSALSYPGRRAQLLLFLRGLRAAPRALLGAMLLLAYAVAIVFLAVCLVILLALLVALVSLPLCAYILVALAVGFVSPSHGRPLWALLAWASDLLFRGVDLAFDGVDYAFDLVDVALERAL